MLNLGVVQSRPIKKTAEYDDKTYYRNLLLSSLTDWSIHDSEFRLPIIKLQGRLV
jgi:hypothetical protein